jgi:hypothetical protein
MELQFHPDPAARKLSTISTTYTIAGLQWITPDDGQRKCPKHVEFHSKTCPMKTELIHEDGRTDGQADKYDEANSRFSQFR